MNPQDQEHWKNSVLEHVLAAFAAHAPLRDMLVFKGARILNLRLGEELRQSLDVDSNLDMAFTVAHSRLEDQQEYLRHEIDAALRHFFSRQNPVRYTVDATKVEMKPHDGRHPFGWTGFLASVALRDNQRPGIRGFPLIEIDVASPEKLRPSSHEDLIVAGHTIQAYTLERLAGEKMRAFLSSLPVYQAKISRRNDSRRVKDLYDLTRIRWRFDLLNEPFWRVVGEEFRLACESRFIDCAGIATFAEGLDVTRAIYEKDPTLPKNIAFDEAWRTVAETVAFFVRCGLVPCAFPLPTSFMDRNS